MKLYLKEKWILKNLKESKNKKRLKNQIELLNIKKSKLEECIKCLLI